MAKIDPNSDKWANEGGASGRLEPVESGTDDYVAVGFEHFEINSKSVVEVRSVCVTDGSANFHRELRDLFFLHSDGAISRFVSFARDGCGWRQPFDPEDPADVEQIINTRPFRATVKATENGKYVRHDCGWSYTSPNLSTDSVTGKVSWSEGQVGAIRHAKAEWAGYQKWRAENPRYQSAPAQSNSGGGGYGGGSGGSGGYDDIPF